MLNSDTPSLGSNIRRLRTEHAWTLQDLATRAAMGKGALSEIERGLRVPRLGGLQRIARALNVEIGLLLAAQQRKSRKSNGHARTIAG